jgi:hypothetical protein
MSKFMVGSQAINLLFGLKQLNSKTSILINY